ncbi:MAG: DUF3306 domain-containing protein [Rhizobiaceae bacterium]
MTSATDFWSKRKAGVRAEAEAELAVAEDTQREAELQELETKTDGEILEELNLPDPDELQLGDDFKAFMGKAVPERIRRRALRKLWLSNPALANLDGLIEYGEDYTDGATVVENLQTAYQVGKGMLKHIEALADVDDEAEISTETEGDSEYLAEDVEITPASAEADSIDDPEGEPPEQAGQPLEVNMVSEARAVPIRRMRFHFSGENQQLQGHEAKG